MRAVLILAFAGLVTLSACDSNVESDSMTGTWETTASFRADTLIPATNYRIKADYDIKFTFDVQEDDGLVWGTVTAVFDGTLISREAGRVADTLVFNSNPILVDQVFGTLSGPEAELDVPWGPYEENLWTFTKVAGRLDLTGNVVNKWKFLQLNVLEPTDFEFLLPNEEAPLVARRADQTTSATSARPTQPEYEPRDLMTMDGNTQRAILKAISATQE